MLVLFETAAGYSLFKVLDDSKLEAADNLWKDFESPEKASKLLQLVSFKRFKDTTDALEAATASVENKCGKTLKKFLKKCVVPDVQDKLAVADSKLGNVIKDSLNISCVSNSAIQELMRGIRLQLDSLVGEISKKDSSAMALGLAHSLCRYKLKFNPDKIDTMIIQAVSLLDDLDKELNNYNMRCREWYGWHFPELGKLIQDHVAYAKTVLKVGLRQNLSHCDVSDILPDDIIKDIRKAVQMSMGTEISELDIINIRHLCEQIIEISEYRMQLAEYLKNRMMALAPNLTALLGELVAARLISHAGSLMNLAKYPASTVQILGAEKALFRALKTHKSTPKYGLIYHAQLIGSAPANLKGKMSRMLAAKAALACRVDALGEDNSADMGIEHRAHLEQRVHILQTQGVKGISGTGKAKAKAESYKFKSEVMTYDTAADSTIPHQKRKFDNFGEKKVKDEPEVKDEYDEEETPASPPKKKMKVKKEAEENGTGEAINGEDEPVPKKKKKKSKKADD